jgi:hypothetical protein
MPDVLLLFPANGITTVLHPEMGAAGKKESRLLSELGEIFN